MLILRPYQEELKADIYEAWRSDPAIKNVLAVMPTGTGKTKTFVSIAMDFAVIPANKTPTAIMVHRKELVQQISLTLAEEGVVHNIIAPRPTILGIVGAHRRLLQKQYYDYSSPISVISVDTLNSRIDKHLKWAQSIKFWITDEAAHLLKNNKWGEAVGYFPNAIGLGVTATPQRLDRKGLGRHADGVFDVMVEGPSTAWAIENGYLCKYKVVIPSSDYENYLKKASDTSDFTREAMATASDASTITGDVVENYIKWASDKQAIVFTTDMRTGAKMEDKFKERGIAAKLLTSLSSDSDRLNSMIDFRERKIKVLINIDLFDEGLDVPGIECVIQARPTMSLSKYLQMCGRGLRPAKGKEYLILIDHVGNWKRHRLPDEIRNWTLDRIIKRRDRVNLLRICQNFKCNSPYDRTLTVCPWCGEEAFSGERAGAGGTRIPPIKVDGDLMLIDPKTLRELEAATVLENPGDVAKRVQKATGNAAAALNAMKNQQVRIKTQKELSNVIAWWAGIQRNRYKLGDRSIHKKFYLLFEQTITEALSHPTAEMNAKMEQIKESESWFLKTLESKSEIETA